MKINRRQQEIALYIYKHPGCKLQYDMQAYFHREKGYHQDTIKKYHNLLMESGHIKVINEGFYFAEDYIDFYPNIIEEKHKEKIEKREEQRKIEEGIAHNKELYQLFFEDDIIASKILNNTDIKISPEGFFILPERFKKVFNDLIYSILIECFYNNPYNWHIIKKPENLDFTIKINTHWSNSDEIFSKLKKNINKCVEDGVLHPFGRSRFYEWLDTESRKNIIQGKEIEELYKLGWATEQMYKKDDEKDHCCNLIGEDLSLVEDVHNYFIKLKETYAKSTKIPRLENITIEEFEESFDYEKRKENLKELENNIKNNIIIAKSEYETIGWYPYIKKPKLEVREKSHRYKYNVEFSVRNIRSFNLHAWGSIIEFIQRRFNMQEISKSYMIKF